MGEWLASSRGELAALSAALAWAISTVIWSHAGRRITPLALNLLKAILATTLLAGSVAISGDLFIRPEVWPATMFLLSGVIGLGIGDTLFFQSLNRIGPRQALLLLFISPPLAALIAFVALGETVSPLGCVGGALTIAGVAWVVTERAGANGMTHHHVMQGILFGLGAAAAQAVQSVLSRAGLESSTTISPLYSAMLRMGAALVFLAVWIYFRRPPGHFTSQLRQPRRLWMFILGATFVGTYLGIWLQQVSLKHTSTGISQTLISTSPLFVVPIAAMLGDRPTLRAVLGALIAFAGIAILFMR